MNTGVMNCPVNHTPRLEPEVHNQAAAETERKRIQHSTVLNINWSLTKEIKENGFPTTWLGSGLARLEDAPTVSSLGYPKGSLCCVQVTDRPDCSGSAV